MPGGSQRVQDDVDAFRDLGGWRGHPDPDLAARVVEASVGRPDDRDRVLTHESTSHHEWQDVDMPRAREIGIGIGVLHTGPTNSVLDIDGVGLGHTTLIRDEAAPPEGRGVARTGVTVLLAAEDAYRRRLAAGGAVLNGAGECTGFLTANEWGMLETPVYLTSTMQLGRVYDAACEIAVEQDPEVANDVVIPVVAECDDSDLNDCRRMQVTA